MLEQELTKTYIGIGAGQDEEKAMREQNKVLGRSGMDPTKAYILARSTEFDDLMDLTAKLMRTVSKEDYLRLVVSPRRMQSLNARTIGGGVNSDPYVAVGGLAED